MTVFFSRPTGAGERTGCSALVSCGSPLAVTSCRALQSSFYLSPKTSRALFVSVRRPPVPRLHSPVLPWRVYPVQPSHGASAQSKVIQSRLSSPLRRAASGHPCPFWSGPDCASHPQRGPLANCGGSLPPPGGRWPDTAISPARGSTVGRRTHTNTGRKVPTYPPADYPSGPFDCFVTQYEITAVRSAPLSPAEPRSASDQPRGPEVYPLPT